MKFGQNSKLGRGPIINVLLRSEKSHDSFSNVERLFIRHLFKYYIKLFGYPPDPFSRFTFDFVTKNMPEPVGQILDVGCSFGFYTFALADAFNDAQVVGVDINDENIDIANQIRDTLRFTNVSFIKADITDNLKLVRTDFNDFDVVILFETLEHVKNDGAALTEIYKLLKKTGLLFVKVPYSSKTETLEAPQAAYRSLSKEALASWAGGYHWRDGYNKESLSDVIMQAGFNLEKAWYVNYPKWLPNNPATFPFVYPLMPAINILSKNRVSTVAKVRKL